MKFEDRSKNLQNFLNDNFESGPSFIEKIEEKENLPENMILTQIEKVNGSLGNNSLVVYVEKIYEISFKEIKKALTKELNIDHFLLDDKNNCFLVLFDYRENETRNIETAPWLIDIILSGI